MNQRQYSIQEIEKRTGVSSHTLRYYERIGLILNVGRASNGHRRYSVCDLQWVHFLKQLKTTGMSLALIQEYAALRRKGETTIKKRRLILEHHREAVLKKIEKLAHCVDVIDSEIEKHKECEQT